MPKAQFRYAKRNGRIMIYADVWPGKTRRLDKLDIVVAVTKCRLAYLRQEACASRGKPGDTVRLAIAEAIGARQPIVIERLKFRKKSRFPEPGLIESAVFADIPMIGIAVPTHGLPALFC